MWFATWRTIARPATPPSQVAIPLRGYVVCNVRPLAPLLLGPKANVAIPLRGYVVCNVAERLARDRLLALESQSPYGAMWFATPEGRRCPRLPHEAVAIPLRGYVVCNRGDGWRTHRAFTAVAIPLRGYVVCNSTPLRTPFWTALPEGGL